MALKSYEIEVKISFQKWFWIFFGNFPKYVIPIIYKLPDIMEIGTQDYLELIAAQVYTRWFTFTCRAAVIALQYNACKVKFKMARRRSTDTLLRLCMRCVIMPPCTPMCKYM